MDDEDTAFSTRAKGKTEKDAIHALGEFRFVKTAGYAFLSITLANLDHFGGCALDSYKAGHALAQDMAKSAAALKAKNTTEATSMLMKAYAMDAFACHFLSDAFSAGHVRTPRRELLSVCGNHFTGGSNPGLLSEWMHNEDNTNGLTVTNKRGNTWKAFGDASLMEPASQNHSDMVSAAIQVSRDEIYAAFLTPTGKNTMKALDYVPSGVVAADSTCGLFMAGAGGQILVRNPWTGINTKPCNYRTLVDSDCPSAAAQKIKAFLGVGKVIDLEYSKTQKGWFSQDPNTK